MRRECRDGSAGFISKPETSKGGHWDGASEHSCGKKRVHILMACLSPDRDFEIAESRSAPVT